MSSESIQALLFLQCMCKNSAGLCNQILSRHASDIHLYIFTCYQEHSGLHYCEMKDVWKHFLWLAIQQEMKQGLEIGEPAGRNTPSIRPDMSGKIYTLLINCEPTMKHGDGGIML